MTCSPSYSTDQVELRSLCIAALSSVDAGRVEADINLRQYSDYDKCTVQRMYHPTPSHSSVLKKTFNWHGFRIRRVRTCADVCATSEFTINGSTTLPAIKYQALNSKISTVDALQRIRAELSQFIGRRSREIITRESSIHLFCFISTVMFTPIRAMLQDNSYS